MRLRLSALFLTLALTGCGGGGEGDSKSAPGSAGTRTTKVSDPAQARQDLESAIATIVDERATGFGYRFEMAGQTVLSGTGVADAATGYRARFEATAPSEGPEDEPAADVLSMRSSQEGSWMQMDGWKSPAKGCWLKLSPTQVPLSILGLTPREPGYISILSDLEATDLTDKPGVLSASLGLASATALLSGEWLLRQEHGTADFGGRRVPMTVVIDGGRVTAITVAGEPLFDSLEKIDADIPAALASAADTLMFEVTYRRSDPIKDPSPPVGGRMEPGNERGCSAPTG